VFLSDSVLVGGKKKRSGGGKDPDACLKVRGITAFNNPKEERRGKEGKKKRESCSHLSHEDSRY